MGLDVDKFYLNQIMKERLIISYLEEKGFFPSKKYLEKYVYRCPLHDGDNDPSFVVYFKHDDSECQNYFCFGCHSGGNIINLVSELEKISLYQAYLNLLKQIDIYDDGRIQFNIASIQDFLRYSESRGNNVRNSELLFLKINTVLRNYLEDLKYDEEEVNRIEKLYPIIDKTAIEEDFLSLEKIYLFLVSGEYLANRVAQYKANEIKKISENSWRI